MLSPKQDINSNQNDKNGFALLEYLNEKLHLLELENSELKKEIIAKSSDKDNIAYYLRLRRELIAEIENLKNEKVANELNLRAEVERLKGENFILVNKLNDLGDEQTQINRNFNSSRTKSTTALSPKTNFAGVTSKYFQYIMPENEGMNFSEENFLSNNKETKVTSNEKNEEAYNVLNLNQNNQNEDEKDSYMPIINDLEERIQILEKILQEKNEEIKKHQLKLLQEKSDSEMEIERLKNEVETMKQKYISILSADKTLHKEIKEHYEKSTWEFKQEKEMAMYELEKKILHMERMMTKSNQDMEAITRSNTEMDNAKFLELENVKNLLKASTENYEGLYKTYEENLKVLAKQLDAFKDLYITRENEFIKVTNYYTESLEEYSATSIDDKGNYKILEENFINQTKETEELKQTVENYINEITDLTNACLDYQPKVRQQISNTLKLYDENLKRIVANHGSIEKKLDTIAAFMNYFETKFIFFASLIEDNKKLEEKINHLECQNKMRKVESNGVENLNLKETVIRMQKEIDMKNNLLKEYEELFDLRDPKDNASTVGHHVNHSVYGLQTSPSKNRGGQKKEFIHEETIKKLKSEISILSSQIVNLTKTKDSIEKFYQVELRNSLQMINEKNEKIEELKTFIHKMENDLSGKKETIFNLWMLEFKEFKENLISITEVKELIEKFKVEGDELNFHKDYILNEELHLLRQEIKLKDTAVEDIKKAHEKEKEKWLDLIANYKATVDGKVKTLESLQVQKREIVSALKNEKERLALIHGNKTKMTEEEMNMWNEQRSLLKKAIDDHLQGKDKEIMLLKNQIEILQKELDNGRVINENNLKTLINSIEGQMNLFKERESFTVSQLISLESRFNIYKEDKERLISLLREEIENIKGHNLLLGKIKSEK